MIFLKKSDKKSRIELYRAVISMKGLNECAAFFGDILTESELDAVNQRFTVARMLTMGMHYDEIREKTGASTATISRINKVLLYGNGGYGKALERAQK